MLSSSHQGPWPLQSMGTRQCDDLDIHADHPCHPLAPCQTRHQTPEVRAMRLSPPEEPSTGRLHPAAPLSTIVHQRTQGTELSQPAHCSLGHTQQAGSCCRRGDGLPSWHRSHAPQQPAQHRTRLPWMSMQPSSVTGHSCSACQALCRPALQPGASLAQAYTPPGAQPTLQDWPMTRPASGRWL